MGLFTKTFTETEPVGKRASEVEVGDRMAAGRHQSFELGNAKAGELVTDVTADGGLIYITGDRAPGYAWTCTPDEIVMIEKEN